MGRFFDREEEDLDRAVSGAKPSPRRLVGGTRGRSHSRILGRVQKESVSAKEPSRLDLPRSNLNFESSHGAIGGAKEEETSDGVTCSKHAIRSRTAVEDWRKKGMSIGKQFRSSACKKAYG